MWKNFCASMGRMFDFSGREKRSVFWLTVAFSLIILAAVAAVMGITVWMQTLFHKTFSIAGTELIFYEEILFAVIGLLLYFPVVSCAVRRLHDTNASGILLIIPVVNLILLCLPSSLKEISESKGIRYGLGQILVLIIFMAATCFGTYFFMEQFNGQKNRDGNFVEATEEQKTLKDLQKENPYLEQETAENKTDSTTAEKKSETENENSKENLLDAGAVIIPILDTRKFNYMKTGDENLPDGRVATQYKHIQTLNIDFITNANIYDTYDSQTVIGNILLGEEYTVLNLLQITNPQMRDDTGEFWMEVAYGNGSGFVFIGRIDNPYRNDNYIPLEQIQIGEKIWTVRKFDSLFSFYHNIDIRNYPGTEGTKVVGKIDASLNNMKTVTSDAITEQDDTSATIIAGEPWIRIEYEGITGWIPGAYADIEHGGVKYQTPGGILKNDLGVGI